MIIIKFIFTLLILISILAGISYYLALRLYRGLATVFSAVRFWQVMVVIAAFTLIMVLGFAKSFLPFPNAITQFFGVVGGYCMGIFLYLLLFTVAADLLLLIPRLIRLPFTTHRLYKGFITASVLFLTLITCVYGFINGRQIDHVSYEIGLQDKKDISDLNVVLISDLHLGALGTEGRLENIVDEINAQKPDLVCIAGDFFDTDFESIKNPEAAIETLRGIKSTFGAFACLGNHDGGETHGKMVDFLEKSNVNLLNDEYTVIDNRLILAGRLDSSPIGGYGGKKRKELSDFLLVEDKSLPVVVMDHNPANIGEYGKETDLIMCGHTHKGQVFPGNLITNSMYEVDYGYYQRDAESPHVIVTSGISSWGMPMRVGTDCEIVNIRFVGN